MGESDSTICGQASKEPRPRGTGHSSTSLWDEPGVLFCIGVALRRLIFQCCIHPQGEEMLGAFLQDLLRYFVRY